MKSVTITEEINQATLELLEEHPEGLRWSVLLEKLHKADPSWHPKTVNGCVWKLVERFPDQVYKPERGLFQLRKYRVSRTQ